MPTLFRRALSNTMPLSRPVAEKERISRIVQQLGMEFGQFVGTLTFKDTTCAGRDASLREGVLAYVRASVKIAYIQIGDTPGRKEPTSGEINYPNVLKHLWNEGCRGFVGI